jgi:hypothetical protein
MTDSGTKTAANRGRGRIALCALVLACVSTVVVAAPPVPDRALPDRCGVPDDTALIDGPLPRLAQRLKSSDPITIVVLGSGSATGSGTSGKEASFPYRLVARIERAYPKSRPRLVVLAETGQTAPVMAARLPREVLPLRPALVIWQTGAADVARGVPVGDFTAALDRGVADLQEQGSDVLLVDGQYSPRAALMINTDAYREAVRWDARRFDLPLLKRYDAMQYWWSNETFDLDAQDKPSQVANADRIHECVAALLFRLIQRGLGAEPR